jgi:predicted RNA-binding protein YlxR (DUF448 family)
MSRLVLRADGSVVLDPTGKAPGRGTYLCEQASCREPRRLAEGVERALGGRVEVAMILAEVEHASA